MSAINLILFLAAFALAFFAFTFVAGTVYHLAELIIEAFRARKGSGPVNAGMA
jgi:hypothetical protein